MLLPEHRNALESLVAGIYGASQPAENVAAPASGIISGLPSPPQVNRAKIDEQLTEEIVSFIRLQCAIQMRARNRAILPPQCQLPIELWAAVFAQLEQCDRVSVSHVSHDWRAAAIASARLWTSPFFLSAAHAAECDCQRCSIQRPCPNCGRRPRPEPDPVSQVQTFIERSGSLPIDLRMAVFPRAAPSARTDLDAVVRPHIHRIESLTFLTSDADVILECLRSFITFSSLKSLTLDLTLGSRATWNCVERVQLEQLRTLNISGQLYCDVDHFELRCPAVTYLKATFTNPLHVLALLRACPSVQSLQLEVGPRSVAAPTTETLEEVHNLLEHACPRVLQITRAYEGDIEAILQLFGTTNIPTFKINCATTEHMERDHLPRFLCNEVTKPDRLECVLHEDTRDVADANIKFRLTVCNATQERTATFDLVESNLVLQNIWARLSPSTLENMTELHVNSSLWPTLLQHGELPGSLPITRAHIIFDESATLGSWLQARAVALRGQSEYSLPRLEVLQFLRFTLHQPIRSEEDLAGTIREAFGLEQTLKSLQLEGFSLEGDLAALRTVSSEIRVI